MVENILSDYNKFYFIGIGGVSMSALAKLLKSLGKSVKGSDVVESDNTIELKGLGISVAINAPDYDIDEAEVVVFTDAISATDRQVVRARNANKVVVSRSVLLNCVSKLYHNIIAVSGCHGKTTATSMLAHIFAQCNVKFTSHIGGNDITFSNFYSTGNNYFLTEACEYNKNFLSLSPTIGVILNSEGDHLECYGSLNELKIAYLKFAEKCKKVVQLYGDLPIEGGITFGFDDRADFYAKNIKGNGGLFSFNAYAYDVMLGKINLNVYGKHNVLNALAAISVAVTEGLPFDKIKCGLESFKGVKRRFENIGKYNGATCIADYAHHPSEISASIKTAKLVCDGDLYIIFQPHTYSRTKLLFKQFVKALSPQRNLLIYKTFAAREYFDDAGSALTLSQAIKRAGYGDSMSDIVYFLSNVKKDDLVIFLGAGDIYEVGKSLLKMMNN